jgi:uncharacterized membrane protein YphA (DoxX/SURF4 family)
MFITAAIVCGLLAAALVMSGRAKLVKNKTVMAVMAKVRFPTDKLWLLAAAEIAGAAGLAAGLFWWPIGVAAATGVIAYFLAAVASHLRVHDKDIAPAAVLLLVAVAALTLRATTT